MKFRRKKVNKFRKRNKKVKQHEDLFVCQVCNERFITNQGLTDECSYSCATGN